MGDLYINDFDDDLRHRLKVRAMQEGILLRDLIDRACRHELRGQHKKATPKPAPKAPEPEPKAVKRAKPKAATFPEPEVVVSDVNVVSDR